MLGKAFGRDGRWPAPKARSSHEPGWTEPPSFCTLPRVKQFPQPRLGSENSAGQGFLWGTFLSFVSSGHAPAQREGGADQTTSAIMPESIWAGPSLIRAAVTPNTSSMDDSLQLPDCCPSSPTETTGLVFTPPLKLEIHLWGQRAGWVSKEKSPTCGLCLSLFTHSLERH